MSNFEFLKSHSQVWALWGAQAEEYLYTDPSSSVTKLRTLAERIAEEAFKAKGLAIKPDKSGRIIYNYAGYVGAISEAKLAPPAVLDAFYINKESGNEGTHEQTATVESATRVLRATHLLAHWFMSSIRGKRLVIPRFMLPTPPSAASSHESDPSSCGEFPGHRAEQSSHTSTSSPPRTSSNAQSSPDTESSEAHRASAAGEERHGDTRRSSSREASEPRANRAVAKSNFEFLRPFDRNLADLGDEAERLFAFSFPGASAARLRLFTELLAKAIARKLGVHVALKASLLECIHAIDQRLVDHRQIVETLDILRQLGNVETHNFMRGVAIASEMMERSYFVASWYVKALLRSNVLVPEYLVPVADPEETVPAWKKFIGMKQGKWASAVIGVLAGIFGYYLAKDEQHRWERALKKTAGLAAFILLLFLIAFPFFMLANGITIWGIYKIFVMSISTQLGWNEYLTRVLGLSLIVPFLYSLRLWLSRIPRRRWTGISVVFAMVIGYNLMFYYAKKGMIFGPDGQPLRYYDVTGEGIAIFDRPGFDPTTGKPLKPVTPEIEREYQIQIREGLRGLQPVDPATHDWFDRTGSPMLWYSGSPKGKMEFFLLPGVNPRTADTLLPVTHEIEEIWEEAHTLKAPKPSTPPDELRAILSPAGSSGPGVLLLPKTADDREGAGALTRYLSGVNTSAIPAEALERRGLASKFYQGNSGMVQDALSITHLKSLVVAEVTIDCAKRSSLDADLLSCDLVADARKFDSHGNLTGSHMVQSTGAGFNRDAAIDAAAQRASKNLSAFAK